jgi:hypothetical protein
MPLFLQVDVNICWAPAGGGNTFLEQQQAAVAGQGQSQYPHVGRVAQRRLYIDAEAIPVATGSEGSVTLANINTALTNAVTALAGASGTPIITPAELAIIQGWASGGT